MLKCQKAIRWPTTGYDFNVLEKIMKPKSFRFTDEIFPTPFWLEQVKPMAVILTWWNQMVNEQDDDNKWSPTVHGTDSEQ